MVGRIPGRLNRQFFYEVNDQPPLPPPGGRWLFLVPDTYIKSSTRFISLKFAQLLTQTRYQVVIIHRLLFKFVEAASRSYN